jgi:hypothetical protein
MAQVIPLRPHTFRLDNTLIDDYATEIGALGVAIYAVLQRHANRTTGQCWPSVATIAKRLRLSKNCVKKYLHLLARRGLITIALRTSADGDPTSNLYTVHDPTQREAVLQRQRARGGVPGAGGGDQMPYPPRLTRTSCPRVGHQHGPKQDPSEQEPGTSLANAPTEDPACTYPGHEHCSPVADLMLCLDCFRCWAVLPPAGPRRRRGSPGPVTPPGGDAARPASWAEPPRQAGPRLSPTLGALPAPNGTACW